LVDIEKLRLTNIRVMNSEKCDGVPMCIKLSGSIGMFTLGNAESMSRKAATRCSLSKKALLMSVVRWVIASIMLFPERNPNM